MSSSSTCRTPQKEPRTRKISQLRSHSWKLWFGGGHGSFRHVQREPLKSQELVGEYFSICAEASGLRHSSYVVLSFPPIAQEKADTAVPRDYYCRRVFINANLCLLKEILLHKNLFWKSSFKIFISGWFLQACLPKNVTYLYTYACICLQ